MNLYLFKFRFILMTKNPNFGQHNSFKKIEKGVGILERLCLKST